MWMFRAIVWAAVGSALLPVTLAYGKSVELLAKSRNAETGEPRLGAVQIDPSKTLVVVIDMWDRHWCKTHAARAANMVPRMNKTLAAARKLGLQVVMAPSDVTSFYNDYPQRAAMIRIPDHAKPSLVDFRPAPEPEGKDVCECGPAAPCHSASVWSRQHPDLLIADEDLIGDTNNDQELLNLCAERDVDTLIYVGVASNMCVCHRDFGMFNMRRHGYRTFFVRDLVEAITANGLDPATRQPDANFTPAKGTHRTERYLEQEISPSFESRQLLAAAGMSSSDHRPHIVFVLAEDEYGTDKTLPAFANEELEPDVCCTFLHASEQNPNEIPGLDALYDADALVLSMRRRFLSVPQMDHLERFIRSGKPIVALRTSVTPFAEGSGENRTETGRVVWQNFDREVLGCNYNFYAPEARESGSDVWSVASAKAHPILEGIASAKFHTPTWIYRVSPLDQGTTILMEGRWSEEEPTQPVAWTFDRGEGRVFYSSLGVSDDFRNPEFKRLLKNAIEWVLGDSTSSTGSGD